jgi:hypothetical protein
MNCLKNIKLPPIYQKAKYIWHFFAENFVRACLHAFFATDAIFGIFENYMLVPQKANFAYHLFWASLNAFPARFAVAGICPHTPCVDFL